MDNNCFKADFYNKIRGLSSNGQIKARFFVPGHKGKNPLQHRGSPDGGLLSSFCPAADIWDGWRFDFTEISGADNLMKPEQALKGSEEKMSLVYGSGASLYSASGSSSCIQAMLALYAAPKSKVLISRNCHVAAIRALAFLDCEAVWLPLKEGRVQPEDIDKYLYESKAETVYITSPDYYGNISDIKNMSKICKKYGARLLVDNAHGAYLKFAEKNGEDMHPIGKGAHACCDSAHKTLPCLTPAAMLHLRKKEDKERAREMLNLFSSTSPSYPVLLSLDIAAELLFKELIDFNGATKRLEKIRNKYNLICDKCDDPLRLILNAGRAGYSGSELESFLLKGGIAPEMNDGQRLVLMAGPYNSAEEFNILDKCLENIKIKDKLNINKIELNEPIIKARPREAVFSPRETVPSGRGAGRIAAGCGVLGPFPGVAMGTALILPGEEISPLQAQLLISAGIMHINVLK